jgi:hypothetical protein
MLCDGKEDCPGGEDEKPPYCGAEKCEEVSNYKCEKTETDLCIPQEWRCDGEAQCPNEDDEKGCTEADCKNGAVWCGKEEVCLASWTWCDGVAHCSDASDESRCDCPHCSGHASVLCRHQGRCIRKTQLCDGHDDCPEQQDEINCPGWCQLDKRVPVVICSDRKFYHRRIACAGILGQCKEQCRNKCDKELTFTCANGYCIPRRELCNGRLDCEDGSDEEGELCSCEESGEGKPFFCPEVVGVPRCIPEKARCDGYPDCPKGEDEKDCDSCESATADPLYCAGTRTCHPSTSKCDGKVDCPDYSDEENCSCSECKSQLYPTFMCRGNSRCLMRDYICNAKSQFHCPGSMPEDEMNCQPDYDPLRQGPKV